MPIAEISALWRHLMHGIAEGLDEKRFQEGNSAVFRASKNDPKSDFLVTFRVNDFYKVLFYIYWANFCIIAKIATNCDIMDFFIFQNFKNISKIFFTEIRPRPENQSFT